MDKQDIKRMAAAIVSSLGLTSSPVGVRLLSETDAAPEVAEELHQHRYCQAGGNLGETTRIHISLCYAESRRLPTGMCAPR